MFRVMAECDNCGRIEQLKLFHETSYFSIEAYSCVLNDFYVKVSFSFLGFAVHLVVVAVPAHSLGKCI